MQCACAILPSVAGPPEQNVLILSHKRYDFRKKRVIEHTFVLTISTNFVWNTSYSKKNWVRCDIYIYIALPVPYQLFLSCCKDTWIFPTHFRKILKCIVFMKICFVIAKLFHADGRTDGRTDGQTDMTKLIFAFRSFAKSAEKRLEMSLYTHTHTHTHIGLYCALFRAQ